MAAEWKADRSGFEYSFGDLEVSEDVHDLFRTVGGEIYLLDRPDAKCDGNMGISWQGLGSLEDMHDQDRYGGVGHVRRSTWASGYFCDGAKLCDGMDVNALLTPEDSVAADWLQISYGRRDGYYVSGHWTTRPITDHVFWADDGMPVALISIGGDTLILPEFDYPQTFVASLSGLPASSVADLPIFRKGGIAEAATITDVSRLDGSKAVYLKMDRLMLEPFEAVWVPAPTPEPRVYDGPLHLRTASWIKLTPAQILFADEADKYRRTA